MVVLREHRFYKTDSHKIYHAASTERPYELENRVRYNRYGYKLMFFIHIMFSTKHHQRITLNTNYLSSLESNSVYLLHYMTSVPD